jgi:hypothetical protein
MWSGFQEAFRLLKSSNVFMHVEERRTTSPTVLAPDQKVSMLKEVDDLLMENIDRMVGNRVAFVVDQGTPPLSVAAPAHEGPLCRRRGRTGEQPVGQVLREVASRHRPLGSLMDSILVH